MTAQIQRRLAALESLRGGNCVDCELARLNRAADGLPAEAGAPCTHPRQSAQKALADLDKKPETTHDDA
jgi:hypothetical protein